MNPLTQEPYAEFWFSTRQVDHVIAARAYGVDSSALSRMKRCGVAPLIGVRSCTTSAAGLSCTTTVAAGPSVQWVKSEETCTVKIAG